MTKQEAQAMVRDHEKLSRQVYGRPTDWRAEKRGKAWVVVCIIKSRRKS